MMKINCTGLTIILVLLAFANSQEKVTIKCSDDGSLKNFIEPLQKAMETWDKCDLYNERLGQAVSVYDTDKCPDQKIVDDCYQQSKESIKELLELDCPAQNAVSKETCIEQVVKGSSNDFKIQETYLEVCPDASYNGSMPIMGIVEGMCELIDEKVESISSEISATSIVSVLAIFSIFVAL